MNEASIEKTIKQVMAVLGEARCYPRTGRTRPDLGAVPMNAGIAHLIDHTLLKPDATASQIEVLCYEALRYDFASVCVNSIYVPLASAILKDKTSKICTSVGFPLGASLPQVKAFEAEEAIRQGAQEIDMVLYSGALKNRDYVALHEDITDVAIVAHENDVICKVTLQTGLLTEEEKIIACQIIKVAGADFVVANAGDDEPHPADVALMRQIVGTGVGVKVMGNIPNLAAAKHLLEVGANRLGTEAGVSIAQEEKNQMIGV